MDRSPRRDVPAEPSRPCRRNILFESHGCDSPGVASHVRGTPETVKAPETGGLVIEGSAYGFADADRSLMDNYPTSRAVRICAEGVTWHVTAIGQAEVFEEILAANR